MNTDSPGDWFGHMAKTDERALQWFAINLMTHNLQKKGLVSGTAVIVCSMMNRKLGCKQVFDKWNLQTPFYFNFLFFSLIVRCG